MGQTNRINLIRRFLANTKSYPILAAIAAGLYPMMFYYSNNYTLVSTWGHLRYFALYYLLLPVVGFYILHRISKTSFFTKLRKYLLPFLNFFVFLFLLTFSIHGNYYLGLSLAILVVSVLLAYFFHRHLKKILLVQLLLAVIGFCILIPSLVRQLRYSKVWMEQPDKIEQVQFQQKPNIYLIQPDGYVNFSLLEKPPYELDATALEDYLTEEGFTHYDNFRANYATTLSSNSATFAMKHHYYNRGSNFGEVINARDNIVDTNPVLSIFDANGYKTHLITELPYLLMSRPNIGFDYCNYSYEHMEYLGSGLRKPRDITIPFKEALAADSTQAKFFFMQIFNPGHIANTKQKTSGAEKEREKWIESWKEANKKVKKLVGIIKEKDPNGLIIIMADHGGYLGLDYARQIYEKTQDRALVYSIFSSQLSIHWPNDTPDVSNTLRTPVNLFRHVFSYVSGDETYLDQLQEDATYIIINKKASKGIYKYIDPAGTIVFDKVN